MPPLLPFAQLDFAGTIALGAGRYLVRPPGEADADPDVLVIRTLGAVRAGSRLRRGKPVPLETEPPPDPLTLSRLTLAKAIPFAGADEARAWLDAVLADEEITGALLDEVIRTTNRALHAYRVAAPDPYAGDLDIETAVAIRFGYGSGQQVAEGRWDAAAELPERRRRSVRAETDRLPSAPRSGSRRSSVAARRSPTRRRCSPTPSVTPIRGARHSPRSGWRSRSRPAPAAAVRSTRSSRRRSPRCASGH